MTILSCCSRQKLKSSLMPSLFPKPLFHLSAHCSTLNIHLDLTTLIASLAVMLVQATTITSHWDQIQWLLSHCWSNPFGTQNWYQDYFNKMKISEIQQKQENKPWGFPLLTEGSNIWEMRLPLTLSQGGFMAMKKTKRCLHLHIQGLSQTLISYLF